MMIPDGYDHMAPPQTATVNRSPDPNILEQVRIAAKMGPMLPYMREDIDKMVEQALASACARIQSGEMTSEGALCTLHEVYVLRTLLKRMTTRVSLGNAAGASVAPAMNIGEQ